MTAFRKSTITLTVLSERSIEGWDTEAVLYECIEGELVLSATEFTEQALDGKGMADALTEAGSDPGFFNLTDDGKEVV